MLAFESNSLVSPRLIDDKGACYSDIDAANVFAVIPVHGRWRARIVDRYGTLRGNFRSTHSSNRTSPAEDILTEFLKAGVGFVQVGDAFVVPSSVKACSRPRFFGREDSTILVFHNGQKVKIKIPVSTAADTLKLHA